MISARARSNRSVSIAHTHAPIETVRWRQCTHRLREVRRDEAAHALAAAELQHGTCSDARHDTAQSAPNRRLAKLSPSGGGRRGRGIMGCF